MEARLQQLAAFPASHMMEHYASGSTSDAFWASLNETSLFANDFLLQSPNRQLHQGGGSSLAESSFFHATARPHHTEAFGANEDEDFSFALSGIVDDEVIEEVASAATTNSGGEPRVHVAHFLAEIMSLSSPVAHSSFSGLLSRRVQLLRRIQEGCARQRLLQRSKHHDHTKVPLTLVPLHLSSLACCLALPPPSA
jgi:hypothetical protein